LLCPSITASISSQVAMLYQREAEFMVETARKDGERKVHALHKLAIIERDEIARLREVIARQEETLLTIPRLEEQYMRTAKHITKTHEWSEKVRCVCYRTYGSHYFRFRFAILSLLYRFCIAFASRSHRFSIACA
jgi:hypothetical protein